MRTLSLFGLTALVLLLPSCSSSPDPKAIVGEVADFYKQKQTVQVNGAFTNTVTMGSNEHKSVQQRLVVLKRPNLVSVQGEQMNIVSDGKTMVISVPALRMSRPAPAPASFDDFIKQALAGAPASLFPAQLMVEDPGAALLKGVTSSEYVGKEAIGGVDAHHLRLNKDNTVMELWVAAEGDPLVLQIAMDMSAQVAQVSQALGAGGDVKSKMVERFDNWVFDGSPSEKTFAVDVPEKSADAGKAMDSLRKRFGQLANNPPAKQTAQGGGDAASTSASKPNTRAAAPPVEVGAAPPLRILSAFYGVNQSWLDVTEKVRASVGNSPSWSKTVSNDDWGDPAPGYEVGNTLIVHYVTQGLSKLSRGYQGKTIKLEPHGPKALATKPKHVDPPDEPERPIVLTAVYGVNQSWLDVTEKFRVRLGTSRSASIIVENREWGDPAPGYEKGNTLIVRYRLGGRHRMAVAYEGRMLKIP